MVRAQIFRYISRPKYKRQSPDCPLVIFSFTALPPCLHCSTSYSSAFAQHCIVAPLALTPRCTRVHPHHLYPPRVSPSDPVSLLQVRPLPTISSESQLRVWWEEYKFALWWTLSINVKHAVPILTCIIFYQCSDFLGVVDATIVQDEYTAGTRIWVG